MGQSMKPLAGMFSNQSIGRRSDLEIAAARAALRSIQDSIGSIESLRAQAGQASWLRPPTKW